MNSTTKFPSNYYLSDASNHIHSHLLTFINNFYEYFENCNYLTHGIQV